jgi:hypothetical protein
MTAAPGVPVEITIEHVLDVVHGFESFGGASIELVAWELCVEEDAVRRAWWEACRDGLLARGPIEPEFGEMLYRLSSRGRQRLPGPDLAATAT